MSGPAYSGRSAMEVGEALGEYDDYCGLKRAKREFDEEADQPDREVDE